MWGRNNFNREVEGNPPAGQLAYTQPFQILSKEGVRKFFFFFSSISLFFQILSKEGMRKYFSPRRGWENVFFSSISLFLLFLNLSKEGVRKCFFSLLFLFFSNSLQRDFCQSLKLSNSLQGGGVFFFFSFSSSSFLILMPIESIDFRQSLNLSNSFWEVSEKVFVVDHSSLT